MAERQIVRVTVYHDSDSIETTIPKAIEWLQSLAAKVPAEHLAESVFEIEQEHDYYDGPSTISIRAYYTRPETDKEMADRMAHLEASARQAREYNEMRERQILAQLKAKYEGERR